MRMPEQLFEVPRRLGRLAGPLERLRRPLDRLKRPLPLAIALLVVAAVGLGSAALAGAFSGQGVAGLAGGGPATTAPLPAVSLKLTPANKASRVRPDAHARVVASGGTIRSVRVSGPDGEPLAGRFAKGHRSWASTGVLSAGSRYRMTVVGVNPSGVVTRKTSSFTTLEPAARLSASVMPLDGETVGVGMPIVIFFNAPVDNRAAVERRLHVTTSTGVAGGWHWFNDKEIHYRPKAYWPTGTKVSLKVDLNGVDAGNGVWGTRDRQIDFRIGQRHVSVVNVNSHKMTVTSGGKTVKVFPMSAGRPKYPTTNGIHFTLEKAKTVTMDSATVGIPRDSPDGYFETVHWNVRISNTGEFVHAAPWSVGSQGSTNVSHGCVNLSVANATWFYNFSQRGDIVQVVGSPKKPNDWALGVVDWNLPWNQWISGSALH
jgi:lipoprotein-anchoring transpeptidase ErfK/SrfK